MNTSAWSPDETGEYEAICREAQAEGRSTRERVNAFRSKIHDARQAHRYFAADVLKDAETTGLRAIFTRWEKTSVGRVAVAHNGALLTKPRVIGTVRADADGRSFHAQTLFDLLTWEEIEKKIQDYARQIAAYRGDIVLAARLLELREIVPTAATPADAVAALGTTVEDFLAVAA